MSPIRSIISDHGGVPFMRITLRQSLVGLMTDAYLQVGEGRY